MGCTANMCYTCLNQDCNSLTDLTSTDIDELTYKDKLQICLGMELEHSTTRQICDICMDQLRIAYRFIETVHESQESLRKFEEETTQSDTIKPNGTDEIVAEETLHQCEYCDLSFSKRWQLSKHSSRVHNSAKIHRCHLCDKTFKQVYHLNEHVRTHGAEKMYECTRCEKKFHRLSSLKRHVSGHDRPPGQKSKRTPFLCTICGKNFPYSNSVQRHMRVHLGIRNHECTICNRKFVQSTHLNVHMRTHTKEKLYICDVCGEAFPLNATLKKHMQKHSVDSFDNVLV